MDNLPPKETTTETNPLSPEQEKPKKLIQFITSDYKELFCIPDGESIRVTYPPKDGREPAEGVCKFSDATHTLIADRMYHICEFAEAMERIGAKYEPVNQVAITLLPTTEGEEKFCTHNREEGNTCAGSVHGSFNHSGDRFRSSFQDRENGLYDAAFQSELQSVIYALRQDILVDRDSMHNYCKARPEAKISEGDFSNGTGKYENFGFKLETETRQYFVNCFVAENKQDSRFTIFAYADKPVPQLEQNRGDKNIPDKNDEGFTSVLGAIDKGKKAPKPPRKEKTPSQQKNKQDEL